MRAARRAARTGCSSECGNWMQVIDATDPRDVGIFLFQVFKADTSDLVFNQFVQQKKAGVFLFEDVCEKNSMHSALVDPKQDPAALALCVELFWDFFDDNVIDCNKFLTKPIGQKNMPYITWYVTLTEDL